MAHEIEADFVSDYYNEEKQCRRCTSFEIQGRVGYCHEAQSEVPANGHCDFFQSID